ncbi:MAG: PP2C family protein-serine/threonine phosphatase [Planctomycetota bacterium]
MASKTSIWIATAPGSGCVSSWTDAVLGSLESVELRGREPVDEATSRLRDGDGALDLLVIEMGPRTAARELSALLGLVRAKARPTAIVAPGGLDASVRRRVALAASTDGLLLFTESDDPREAAKQVAAVLQRQPLIDRLREELLLSSVGERRVSKELEIVHEELSWAARMQGDLVLRPGEGIGRVDAGVLSRPATYVSGDLFDIEKLDDHTLSFFLADAVGHGVPAAMMTLFLSSAMPKVDGYGPKGRIVPPGEALTRLNNAFLRRAGGTGRFATGVYGLIHTETLETRIATAGHPPPILSRRDGRVERIDTGGPLLGVFEEQMFPEVEISLAEHESIVLYSDGFETAFDRPGEKGQADPDEYVRRLTALGVNAAGPLAVRGAIAALEREIDAFAGSLHRDDDVTALVISVPERGGEAREAA